MTWRACSASQRAFFSFFSIAFLSLPHFFSSFDINCTPSSFVYEYLDSRVREDDVSSSRKSAKFSRAGWKKKVEAIYRHRWIKRSSVYVSRAGNVRPKVAPFTRAMSSALSFPDTLRRGFVSSFHRQLFSKVEQKLEREERKNTRCIDTRCTSTNSMGCEWR